MKETGIIMSGNHPTLILNGTKTMTRRTYGLEKINESPDDWQLVATFQDGLARFYNIYNIKTEQDITIKCPYGGYGDRLWVRETIYYNADKKIYKADIDKMPEGWGCISSRFMYKSLARIWLEITEVRVERLQDITPLDAVYEGCPKYHEYNDKWECIKTVSPIDRFHLLWDSLNAKRGYGWEANPWLWVISFNKLRGVE